MATIALIPAYNPTGQLLEFVKDLRATQVFREIVVVNDGSREDCQSIFSKLSAFPDVCVLQHAVNLGKGAALKTGMNYFSITHPDSAGVVTADADGQHLVADVVRVAERLEESPDSLVIGARTFDGSVPLRSKVGNLATRYIFWALVGTKLTDTQSGLRGIPRHFANELLRLTTGGYEFELDMLIQSRQRHVAIIECPIETVYIDDNSSSHFNPLLDSLRIYFVLLRFMTASLATAAVDYLVFVLAYGMTLNILVSQSCARLFATGINFSLARGMVFRSREKVGNSLPKFLCLVAVMGAVSYLLLNTIIAATGCSVIAAKVSAELLVYFANFSVQRNFVFKNSEPLVAESNEKPFETSHQQRRAA